MASSAGVPPSSCGVVVGGWGGRRGLGVLLVVVLVGALFAAAPSSLAQSGCDRSATDTTVAIDASDSESDLAVDEGEALSVVVTASPAPRCSGGGFVEVVLGTAELSDVGNRFGQSFRIAPGVARYVVSVPTVVDSDGDDEALSLRVRSEVPWAEPYIAHTDQQRAAKLAALVHVPATISDTASGDAEIPQLTISAGPAVDEGGDAVFTLTADPAPTSALEVSVVLSESGSFAAPGELGTRLVEIPADQSSVSVSVQTVDDGAAEADGSIMALLPSSVYSSQIQRVSVPVSDTGGQTVTIAGGPAVTEGTAATFTVSASHALTEDLVVGLLVSDAGGFVAPADRGAKTVTISAGQSSATYSVATVGDSASEPNGSVTVRVGSGQGYSAGSPGSASVAVLDDDGAPTVTITGGQGVTEGSNAEFTVRASHAPTANLSVGLRVSDSGGFVASGNKGAKTVTINSGQTSATYTVATVGDTTAEPDGSVHVALGSGSGYSVGSPASASVAVADDDGEPTVTITGHDPVREGQEASFTVRASHAPSVSLVVSLQVSDAGGYVAAANKGAKTVTINQGSTTATYRVATVGDSVEEPNGSVTVSVGSGSGYSVGSPASALVRVADDDGAPTVTITGGQGVTEGSNAEFTVSASHAPSSNLSVSVFVSQSGDYVAAGDRGAKTVTINSGQTSVSYRVATVDDLTEEADGQVHVRLLSGGTAYRQGSPNSASVAVSSNDSEPTVTITGGPAVTEGSGAVFTVRASHAPTANIPVSVQVSDAAGSDFVAAGDEGAKTVTINSGSTTATLTVGTEGDSTAEADGPVTVRLGSGSGYRLGRPASAQVRVADDDTAPLVSISAGPAVAEGQTAVFTVTASRAHQSAVAVSVAVNDSGDFIAPSDRSTHTVTIPAGDLTADLEIATVDDSDDEVDGSVTARLAKGTGYRLRSPLSATVRVDDGDGPPSGDIGVDASIPSEVVNEGAPLRILFELTRPSPRSVFVPVVVAAPTGTALTNHPLSTNPADAGEFATPGRLEIPAGVTSHVAEIATRYDADTADEVVGVTLGFLPSGYEADGNLLRRPAVPAVKADPNADPPVDAAPAIPATPARQTIFVINDIHKTASLPVSLSVSPSPVIEGQPFTVTATFSDDGSAALQTDKAIPIAFTFPAGTTATDLGTLPATITVPANRPSGSVTIATRYDADQTDGGFTVAIDQDNLPFGVTAGSPLTQTLVISDTTPTAQFADAVYTVDEGATTVVTVELTEPAPRDIAVPITVGTLPLADQPNAAETADWELSATTVTIRKGESTAPVVLSANLDSDLDDELLMLEIGDLAGRAVKHATLGEARIAISDTTPTLTLSHSTLSLVEGGSADVRLDLNQRAPAGGISGELRVAAKGGAATAEAGDVTVAPVRFTIPEGQFATTVTVSAAADSDLDDEKTAIGVAGLDDTRVRLDTAKSSIAVTVYDTGESRIGFNAAHRNGGFDGFAGPGYIGENVRATFYLGLASAPRADVTAVAEIVLGTQTQRWDSNGDGTVDTSDGLRFTDSLRDSDGNRVADTDTGDEADGMGDYTITFTPTGWTHKPLTVQSGRNSRFGDQPIVVEFTLTSTDPAYHGKTWRLVVIAIDRDGEFLVEVVGYDEDYIDIGSENDGQTKGRLEVRANRRAGVPATINPRVDRGTGFRVEGARVDRDDFVVYGRSIPVGGTTGHIIVNITDDNIVERTEYLRVESRRAGLSDRDEVTLRIRDDDVSYVQVINNGIQFSKKFYTDIAVVLCAVGGQRFTGNPMWARPDLYAGATLLNLPSEADLAEIGGIVVMLPALPVYTWDHDGISSTPQVPYLAYDEWDTDVVQHPQGFDVQIGASADADCTVDFGGQPQRN